MYLSLYFLIISHWKHLNKLAIESPSPFWRGRGSSFEHTSPSDALCQVWLNLGHWFWRRRFINFVSVFLLLCYPLGKGRALLLNKFEFTQGWFVPVWNWLSVPEKHIFKSQVMGWFYSELLDAILSFNYMYFVIISTWGHVLSFDQPFRFR